MSTPTVTPIRFPVFGYGSNSLVQICERVRAPFDQIPASKARLPGYKRIFIGYSSRWGGATASVTEVTVNTDNIQIKEGCRGTLCWLTQQELERLDRYEGIGDSRMYHCTDSRINVYHRKKVKVRVWVPLNGSNDYTDSGPGHKCCYSNMGSKDDQSALLTLQQMIKSSQEVLLTNDIRDIIPQQDSIKIASDNPNQIETQNQTASKTIIAWTYIRNVHDGDQDINAILRAQPPSSLAMPSIKYIAACVTNLETFWQSSEISDDLEGLEKIEGVEEEKKDCIHS